LTAAISEAAAAGEGVVTITASLPLSAAGRLADFIETGIDELVGATQPSKEDGR